MIVFQEFIQNIHSREQQLTDEKKKFKKNDLHSIGKKWKTKSRLADIVVYRKMVAAIGTSAVKANEPKILREYGGSFELTEGLSQNILKAVDWVKRKGVTGKVEPCPKFLEEEKFTFQCATSKFVSDHDIPIKLVLNLDQTPLSYVLPEKQIFDLKGSKTVPIKGVDNKRQITATFIVTASGSILSIQLIYSSKTKCGIPKYDFRSCFDFTFILNH